MAKVWPTTEIPKTQEVACCLSLLPLVIPVLAAAAAAVGAADMMFQGYNPAFLSHALSIDIERCLHTPVPH